MKNLTQLPGSGKGLKAKNDNTLGRMHGGIRSRIGSMSLKNTSLFGIILTLLLTFGVGEMWGTTWTVAASSTDIINGSSTWSPTVASNDLTNISGNYWALEVTGKSPSSTSYQFKICQDHAWTTAYPGSNFNFTNVATGSGTTILYTFNSSTHAINAYGFKTWTVAGTEAALGSSWNTTDTNNKMSKGSNVYTYTLTKKNVALTSGTTYECKIVKDGAYTVSFPASNKTFSVGTTGRYDITYSIDLSTQTVSVSTTPSTYTITLNGNGGSGHTSSVTATYNSSTLASITNPTKTGYTFAGWYTGSGGTGTLVINTSGVLQANVSNYTGAGGKWVGTEAKTLYAKWTAKTYSITLDDNGDYQGNGSATATYGNTSLAVSSHASRTSWNLVGYWTASGSGGSQVSDASGNLIANVDGYTDSNGKWIKDATCSLYAHWSQTNSLSVVAGDHISTATGSVSPVTLGSSYAISASGFDTGYEFYNWTADPAGNGAFASSTSASTNVTVSNGSVTVTANARPITYTISYSLDGGTNYDGAPTSYTIESSAIVLGTPTKEHYHFDGWTIGGSPVTSIPTGSTGNKTLVANWTPLPKVYLKNTMNWANAYVTFYKGEYWDASNGAGSNRSSDRYVADPAAMTYNSSTGLFEYECPDVYTYTYACFTKDKQDNYGNFWSTEAIYFNDNFQYDRVAVVAAQISSLMNDETVRYYTTKTNGNLEFVTLVAGSGTGWFFPGGWSSWETKTTEFSWNSSPNVRFTKELSANTDYEFKIYNHGVYYGNASTYSASGSKTFTNGADNCTLHTTLAGIYTFDFNTSTKSLTISYPAVYAVSGSFNSWTETSNLDFTGNDGYYEVTITGSSTNCEFKVLDNAIWYGHANKTFTGTESDVTLSTGGNNIKLTADIYPSGTYVFAYNKSTHKLGVTYPSAHTVTYGVGTNAGTTTVTMSPNIASGKKIIDTQSLTFSKGDTKAGYTWKGWYANAAGTGDALGTAATYTSSSRAADVSIYACYNLINYTITYNLNGGTNPVSPAPATSFTVASSAITLPTPTRTGYTFNGWYANSDLTTGGVQTTIAAGTTGNKVYWAKWTPKTTTITLNNQDATTPGSTSVTATYDADMPEITLPTKTGYTFGGYWGAPSGSGPQYYNADGSSAQTWNNENSTYTLYAKWTANGYTVTIDVDEENKGTIAGATTSQSVTYGAALTTIPNLPTAADGYGLDGYYTDQNGAGTKVINGDGTWIASVEGYTDADTKWIRDGGVTLYAYYKQAEITELTLAETIVGTAETDSITVTPVIDPTPAGTTIICWEVQYSNGNALSPQPAGRLVSGNTYRFKAPTASATYKIQATLRSGAVCGGGSVLSTRVATFQVAGEHTVTVLYKCGDLTLAASSEVNARPLEWSDVITAPTITGYTFSGWEAGDGVTIKDDEDATATTHIKAVYDGTLTANYTKKRLIYFNNTLNWANVYVYFYKNNSYWGGSNQGTGANTTWEFTNTPYSEGLHGEMTQIDGTNIYYFDAEAAGVSASYTTVVFTELQQHDCDYFYNSNKVIKRDDYKSTTLPMFVPIADQTPINMNSGTAAYYSEGYWMNYPESTGYTLKIYNKVEDGGDAPYELQSIPFTFTADYTMPMEIEAELEANRTYGFKVYRADNSYYGNNGTMTANTTNWAITTGTNNCGLRTTVAGNYTFSLAYFAEAGDYKYRVGVTYPVAANDYRIVYSDLAAWSGATHTAAWIHPSRVITKNSGSEAKQDTVSFFWAYGSSPALKYQTCTAVGEGSATWSAGTAISVSSFSSVLTETGVYNFIFEQPAGGASISLVKVEPYEGKYYIRTDCAGATKWANYRTIDHEMTYSDYAETNSGFSHYFAHWVTSGTNVKFTIANDYSPCVSDTLVADYGTVVANINAGGDLVSGNANIRYMWNQSDNKLSRAYISGSGNIADRFLVLEGDAKMYDENGNALTTAGGGKISGLEDNEMNLIDDENFVYERTIQVNTQARAKLTAKYNNNVQYFIGGASETVELLGGAASDTKHTMRIVYDFKTNRLVKAYIPSGADIKDDLAINADIMLVREHQNAGQQLTFDGGSLSAVKTVYGVMRFNRWTLNNKEKTGEHSPVGDPKSTYERSLYWISFPFDVNLSDVFGFGTYGTHWIIEEYDGAERATEGYWKDSEGFWKYITNRRGVTLEAGKGYILALDLDLMRDNNTSFWSNNIEQVELFFPSAAAVENIEETDTEIDVPAHECTIATRPGMSDDRTKKDSHWNIIGVPSYANYGETLEDGDGETITWNDDPETKDLPFLYEWNMVDNSYSVQSGSTYPFKSMHAYMVQYFGKIKWSLASATPVSPVVARHADAPQDVEFRLELQAGEKVADQTFVKMTTDEQISTAFDFNYDLSKQMNSGKANIYTMVEGYIQTAGNCLPMSEQTTVVPVGVKIAADGDYTFAIPDGTEGVGVTLIDNETGIRTSLSALAYTVSLEAGTYDERFVLEISPIHNVPTEQSAVRDQQTDVRKVLIDGLLYIVRDNKMYDARGAMIMEK